MNRLLRCVFFGTDEISLASLAALHERTRASSALLSSLRVVTPEGAKNQRQAVADYCGEHGIEMERVPAGGEQRRQWWQAFEARVLDEADVAVVVSFGQRIPDALIERLPFGCINVHPSLLPKYRGAAPIVWTLINRDREAGASVVKMTSGPFDSGPVLAQRRVPLDAARWPRYPALAEQLARVGAELLVDTVAQLPARLAAPLFVQDEQQASRAPKIRFEDGRVQWQHWSAAAVEARFRALYGLHGLHARLHAQLGRKQLALLDVRLPDTDSTPLVVAQPGTAVYDRDADALLVACAGGGCIAVDKLAFTGARQPMTARDFANGYLFPQQRTHVVLG